MRSHPAGAAGALQQHPTAVRQQGQTAVRICESSRDYITHHVMMMMMMMMSNCKLSFHKCISTTWTDIILIDFKMVFRLELALESIMFRITWKCPAESAGLSAVWFDSVIRLSTCNCSNAGVSLPAASHRCGQQMWREEDQWAVWGGPGGWFTVQIWSL